MGFGAGRGWDVRVVGGITLSIPVAHNVGDVPVAVDLGRREMAERVRAFDWSATPLGPMEGWPAALRTAVDICLNSPAPMFVWWGPELINIHNDAYAPILGARHPSALGRAARTIWAEVWPDIGADVDRVVLRGESVSKQRVRFVLERN